MAKLKQLWKILTTPLAQDEDESRREYMTRVIFVWISCGLVSMSVIVPVFDFYVGDPEYISSFIMLAADSIMLIGWFLILRGHWQISRLVLPAIFLSLGGYLTFNAGLMTTGILSLAIAVILTAMLFENRAQWAVVVFSLILYLGLGWVSGERDFEGFFTAGVVVGFSLSGIALLQRFSSDLLFTSVERLRQAEMVSRQATDKVRQQAARTEALASLSDLFSHATLDYQLVLDTVVRQCVNLIGDGASIFLYSPESDFLELVAKYNSDPQAVEIFTDEVRNHPIRVDEGGYKVVVESRQPVLVPVLSVENLIESVSPERRDYYQKLPLYSLMLVPLQARGELLGVLGLGRHAPGKDYTPEDLKFLQDIADRSALAMLNAQIYKELGQELAERKRVEAKIRQLAITDALTELFNRREFEKRLERALTSAKERNFSHVLCYLDLDQFKIVNDTAGHAAGDELLKQLSRLLSVLFRQRDTLARLGGDEFGLLLENCQLDPAITICDDILARINNFSFVWEGKSFHVGVSIGVVPITAEKENTTQLLSQADIACYTAKDLGRNRVYVYQMEDSETVQRHSELLQASNMRDAIVHDQFLLYCQPIVQLTGDRPGPSNYEVLLRMVNDKDDLVLPSVFIPPAERYGLMPTIDRWVIRQTFSAMSKYDIDRVQISINLSGNSLDDDSLLDYVLQQLQEFSILPDQICFEITETAAIHRLSKAQKFIQEFQERGGKIALDDFGSGFSSFRYLKTLSVDFIKIDGAFVRDMLANPGDQAMVEAITRVAHTLGIYVIAEHATDQETVNRLREIGVEGAQGFGIGFPVPVEVAWGKK